MTELTTFRHTAIIYNQFTAGFIDGQRVRRGCGCIIDHTVIEVNSQRFGTVGRIRSERQSGTIVYIAKHFDCRILQVLSFVKCRHKGCVLLATCRTGHCHFCLPFLELRRIGHIFRHRNNLLIPSEELIRIGSTRINRC